MVNERHALEQNKSPTPARFFRGIKMKITELEIHILRAPDTGRPHWVSNFRSPPVSNTLSYYPGHAPPGRRGFKIQTKELYK